MKYLFYTATPTIYKRNFIGETPLKGKKFGSIKSMLYAMEEEKYCLREMNWEITGYKWGIIPISITLRELHEEKYLSFQTRKDEVSLYYLFRNEYEYEPQYVSGENPNTLRWKGFQ